MNNNVVKCKRINYTYVGLKPNASLSVIRWLKPTAMKYARYRTRVKARQKSGPKGKGLWGEAFFCLDLLVTFVSRQR